VVRFVDPALTETDRHAQTYKTHTHAHTHTHKHTRTQREREREREREKTHTHTHTHERRTFRYTHVSHVLIHSYNTWQISDDIAVIEGTIDGLRPGPHGLHVHEYGDFTDGERDDG
jgi:Cu/Zn superoxide dismutase